jgi:hypothetical protein
MYPIFTPVNVGEKHCGTVSTRLVLIPIFILSAKAAEKTHRFNEGRRRARFHAVRAKPSTRNTSGNSLPARIVVADLRHVPCNLIEDNFCIS